VDATDYTVSQGHITRTINNPSYWNLYIKQFLGRTSLQEPINWEMLRKAKLSVKENAIKSNIPAWCGVGEKKKRHDLGNTPILTNTCISITKCVWRELQDLQWFVVVMNITVPDTNITNRLSTVPNLPIIWRHTKQHLFQGAFQFQTIYARKSTSAWESQQKQWGTCENVEPVKAKRAGKWR